MQVPCIVYLIRPFDDDIRNEAEHHTLTNYVQESCFRCPISFCEATTGFFPNTFRIFSGSRSLMTLIVDIVFVVFKMLLLVLSLSRCRGWETDDFSCFVLLERLSPSSCLGCSLALLWFVLEFNFVWLSLERCFREGL